MKAFVEAAERLPDIAPEHQKCSGRLFHRTRLIQIAIQVSVDAGSPDSRPQAIDSEQFENQRERRRKTADGKSGLRAPRRVDQLSRRQTVLTARVTRASTEVSNCTSGFSSSTNSASVARTP